jgi:hypothetical protein
MIYKRISINTITNNIISYIFKLLYSFINNIKLYLYHQIKGAKKVIRYRNTAKILSQNKSQNIKYLLVNDIRNNPS